MAGRKGARWGVRREIVAALAAADRPLTQREIAAAIGRDNTAVWTNLLKLYLAAEIERSGETTRWHPRTYWLRTK